MKMLLLLILINLLLIVFTNAVSAQDAASSSATAVESEELAGRLRAPSTVPSPAGIYSAGRWRSGVSFGMASAVGRTYTTVGVGAGYHLMDGLEVGADVRGWLSSGPGILEISPQVRYVAWQLPGFKPYAGAFYRWNQSRDVVTANSYGGRLGVLYNKSNSSLYMGAGLVWEHLAAGSATRFSGGRSLVYPELVVSAGPVVVSASKAPRF